MGRFVDLAGRTLGALTVEARAVGADRRTYWSCRCSCGAVCVVEGGNLKSGKQQSCGCHRAQQCRATFTTHGASVEMTREYRSWRNAKSRCGDPNNVRYAEYGGRGIAVCERWRDSFETFLADMGPCPEGCTLDRVKNERGYEPGNCRWATPKVQANNVRRNIRVTVDGRSMTLKEAAEYSGVPYYRLYAAHRRGEDVPAAIEQLRDPIHSRASRRPSAPAAQ